MRVLVDTHILLWAIYRPERISSVMQARLRDRANAVYFSAISIAEIAIKSSLGRADFSFAPDEVSRAARDSAFDELPLTAAHASRLVSLAWHHRDPFDRFLVAQAIEESVRLMTADSVLLAYSDLVELV
ncbi:MAG: type II toxin-antitoxin system VapC family toxin [Sulfuritalea sp.]|nr:type II toxin-antitoxin system VapC family toxin [Sulfuritalea sp.]